MSPRDATNLQTLDLSLRLREVLDVRPQPGGVADRAREIGTSTTTT
jgi:hypothetical protein